MSKFVHLHLHSHYSLLDGAGKISDILSRVKELGMDSVALTDHGVMYGIIDFYEKSHNAEVKSILGVEGYVAPRTRFDKTPHIDNKPYHIILLAESFEGYQNLLKIVSEAHLNGYYYKPRIDKDFLRDHAKGIIATSACFQGELSRKIISSKDEAERALDEYKSIFGENNFFIELQKHPEFTRDIDHARDMAKSYDLLVDLAQKTKTQVVATNDVHYVHASDWEAQDALVCVQSGKQVADTNRISYVGFDLSIKSPDQMAELFADLPEAIENTSKIAQRCQVEIPMGTSILPDFPVPAGTTAKSELRRQCIEGVKTRFFFDYKKQQDWKESEILPSPSNDLTEEMTMRVAKRMEYELSIIEKMGFESYFLITADFINWARKQNIAIGPGRGSAAGSLVGFLTGITDIDPLHYNLIFERFLNPERISMPDIDTDIMDARRDEVIDYVRIKYGADHVAQIITFGTMLARNAIRDIGRVLGFAYQECDYLAKLIPFGSTLKEALESVNDLKDSYNANERNKKLLDLAQRVEGVARHTSVHAAGVVISKEPLTSYLPIQYAVKDDKAVITQYAMNDVDHLGLLKMDFLGLANLNIIQRALEIIEAIHEQKIEIRNMATDDQEAYKLLSRAETTGVFQLESAGMKRYLRELKPTEFEDIISMVALYRPGPMDSIPTFIDSKHGRQTITYLHPILEPILEKTYGIIVTQDQVLQIARDFAGFTYGEADVLRKAVGKKIKKLLEQREKFIDGAVKNKKIDRSTAQKVWDFIEPFARYGFNRAHAACYAMIAYQTAFLKAHYPVEFMAALLTSDLNNLDRIGIEITECQGMGVEVLPPDVNKSFVDFGVVKKDVEMNGRSSLQCTCQQDSHIYFGLAAIKNVGADVSKKILKNRKEFGEFANFTDFLVRLGSDVVNKKVLENLAKSGALDSLIERQQVLANIDKILDFTQAVSKQKNTDQSGLFGEITTETPDYVLTLDKVSEADSKTRLAWEKELLGIYLSDHPMEYLETLIPADAEALNKITTDRDGQPVRTAGVIARSRTIMTKNNQPMAFVTIEDQSSEIELIVFPRVFEQYSDFWQEGRAILVDGTISSKDNRSGGTMSEAKILANKVWELHENPQGKIPGFDPKANRRRNFNGNKNNVEMTSRVISTEDDNTRPLIIHLPEGSSKQILIDMKAIFEKCPGDSPVILKIWQNGQEQTIATKTKVTVNGIISHQLRDLIGKENIEL